MVSEGRGNVIDRICRKNVPADAARHSFRKKLNITTVAEGVETKDQCEMLKTSGCDIAQGFYYAKPMQEKLFKEFLGMKEKQSV